MAYTRAEIEAARRRQLEVARIQGEARPMREGVKSMQVDPVLYHNAVQTNRRVYGVRDCWSEPEFRRDMAKRHPELAVKTVSDRIMVGAGGNTQGGTGRLLPGLGRVTFHKRYPQSGRGRKCAR